MKYYTHKPVELKKLTPQTVNFKRFYETPDGNLYPSITTVLSTRNKKGLFDFLRILEEMKEFNCVEFNIGDIVRSGFVRNYLIQKTKLGMGME